MKLEFMRRGGNDIKEPQTEKVLHPFVEVVGMKDGAEQVRSVGRNGTSLSKALANRSAVSSNGISLPADGMVRG